MRCLDVTQEFFRRVHTLRQAQIDWLVVRHTVPAMALVQDADREGMVIGAAKVEKSGGRFEFREDGEGAYVILARDIDGEAADLIAWAPRADWFAPWFGAVPLLGMHELLKPTLGEPLPVYLNPLSWLRGGRAGVVVLDRTCAWRVLEGRRILAETVEEGIILRKLLTPPRPNIVVPADILRRAA